MFANAVGTAVSRVRCCQNSRCIPKLGNVKRISLHSLAIAVLLIGVLAPGQHVQAATINGRLTTSVYSWKVNELDGTDASHVRFYQTAIANVRNISGSGISVNTYGQFSGDLADAASGRQKYRIYHAYASWLQTGSIGLQVKAGRHRVYGAVGFGTVDGLQVEAAPTSALRLKGYAGILVPIESDAGFGTWDEGHLYGGQATIDIQTTTVGLSFAKRSREPIRYIGPGRYSGLTVANPGEQLSRVGIDIRSELGPVDLYARSDFETTDFVLQELELVGHVQASEAIRLTTEFHHREPTIYLNSILSVFELSTDREVAGRVHYRVSPLLTLQADVAYVDYDGDTAWRIGTGVMVGNGYFGYNRRLGYGGENDALMFSYMHPVSEKLTLKVDGSLAGYRLYEGQEERDQALATSVGFRIRPRKGWSFDAEGQFLRNKYYSNDFRIFARGTVWFFVRR